MGAWGAGTFENDGALDWVGELEDQDDLTLVLETLAQRDEAGEGGDAVLAAAEVVAALNGSPAADLDEDVADWIVDKPAPGDDVTRAALEGVAWVWSSSELRELWEDSDSMPEWTSAVEDLRSRLAAPIVPRELKPRDMEKLQAKRKQLEDMWDETYPLNQEGAPGDLFGIPLKDGRLALGVVLEYEPRDEVNGLAQGVGAIFRQTIAANEEPPSEVPPLDDVIACLAMGWWDLESGKWKILRRGLPTDVAAEAHKLALAGEREHANPAHGHVGCVIVEQLANGFHALGPWNMYAGGPDAYDRWLLSDDRKPERRIYMPEDETRST